MNRRTPTIAMADMTWAPIVIVILLITAIVVVRLIRHSDTPSGIWLPFSAFASGPILATIYFAADVFLISRDYLTRDDYVNTLVPVLMIGFTAGTIGSIAFWCADHLRFNGAEANSGEPHLVPTDKPLDNEIARIPDKPS